MNWLKKITSFGFLLFVLLFFSVASLNSCGTRDRGGESTEQPAEEAEHPTGEEEHPTGTDEHPTGAEEHPTGAEEDTTQVQ
jgi:hypothetical protein